MLVESFGWLSRAGEQLALLLADGEAQKARWVRSGELVSIEQMALAWATTAADLEQCERRGEVCSLDVDGARCYPREWLSIDAAIVSSINRQLPTGYDAASLFIFWRRRHGVLQDRTVSETLQQDGASGLEQVKRLAAAYAAEAMPHAPDATSSSPQHFMT